MCLCPFDFIPTQLPVSLLPQPPGWTTHCLCHILSYLISYIDTKNQNLKAAQIMSKEVIIKHCSDGHLQSAY